MSQASTFNSLEQLLLSSNLNDYTFVKNSNKDIEGVDDMADFKALTDAMRIIKFSPEDQNDLFRCIAAVLHMGNLTFSADSKDRALLTEDGCKVAERVCHVLGIPVGEFSKSLLTPKIKAGRDWVVQDRNVEQCQYSVEALARALYERMFGALVEKINECLYTPSVKATFIGVLDIAGFEIFDINSFEQLCINYTNEKLQQFFNHRMFILEQEEYRREGIEWKFIDFGLDLQPTIDLIEKTKPIGILSCLDEECVMPKATDKTFIDKLNGLWKDKSNKYETPRFNQSFILTHYAGKVEYTTAGWLDKNKDPLNENITRLLANSSYPYLTKLFSDYSGVEDQSVNTSVRSNVIKKGAFRTVAQRHKEQLSSLMNQLYSTEPHFVRCIIPNEEKKPRKLNVNQALEQLRCNGVLEGIRICRAGFPNRVVFADFRQRYELLAPHAVPTGFMDGRKASQLILEELQLDNNQYRVGNSKVFFRAGVLAQLEEQRDVRVAKLILRIQRLARGFLARKVFKKKLDQMRAIKVIQKNARVYVTLREWAWWRLYSKVKPLLNVTRNDEELRQKDLLAKEWEEKALKEQEEKTRLEQLKAQLEAEKKRIEELLLQEQNAAADQAEILARTQKREVDLNDQLANLGSELESKESANEELTKSKKKVEIELTNVRQQLDEARANIDKLEKDRAAKEQRVSELEAELKNETESSQKLSQDKKSLEAQLAALNNDLTSTGSEASELLRHKNKLTAQVAELEQKIEADAEERAKLEQKKASLEQELRTAQETVDDLNRQKQDLQGQIQKKDSEIKSLTDNLERETSEKNIVEQQRRDLQGQLGNLASELDSEKAEREKGNKQRKKLEEEIEKLADMMSQKGSEGDKQSQILAMRDSELSDLRNQLATTQSDFEDNRKKNQHQLESLRGELDAAKSEISNVTRAKQNVEKELSSVTADLEASEEAKARVEKSKRSAEMELQVARSRIEELENALKDLQLSKEALEKQLMEMTNKFDESEISRERLERERDLLSKQVDSLKDEVEEEARKRTALESQKKKASVEVSDLQARLDEEELLKVRFVIS